MANRLPSMDWHPLGREVWMLTGLTHPNIQLVVFCIRTVAALSLKLKM
uniref:Uncharacterized protein n=1 Tax=Anguilla anguilla TaxID=7936 RepID=A0A0E9PPC1_ANGAN